MNSFSSPNREYRVIHTFSSGGWWCTNTVASGSLSFAPELGVIDLRSAACLCSFVGIEMLLPLNVLSTCAPLCLC